MDKPARSKWFKWVLWTPFVLAILGFAGMLIAEYRINSQINAEVALLIKMGVDIKDVSPDQNVAPDYERMLPTIKGELRNYGLHEPTVAALESLSQKPFACFNEESETPRTVAEWLRERATYATEEKDLAMMKRLFDLSKSVEAQFAGGNVGMLYSPIRLDMIELPILRKFDAETCVWYRKQVEEFDYERLAVAQLSRTGRDIRSCLQRSFRPKRNSGIIIPLGGRSLPGSPHRQRPWYAGFVEGQTVFRKSAELISLRTFRRIAKEALSKSSVEAASAMMIDRWRSEMNAEGSWQAEWAADRSYFVLPISFPDHHWRTHQDLIKIDLLESKARMRPMVPTWSRKYCVEPQSGKPVSVTLYGRTIRFIVDGRIEVDTWPGYN
jgi:hypothetical protein